MKFGLVCALFFAAILWVGDKAHADEPTTPPGVIVECGATITWYATSPSLDPPGQEAAIAWAYQQVQPEAGLHATQQYDGDLRWSWDPIGGLYFGWQNGADGQTHWFQHTRSTTPADNTELRRQVLDDVVTDLTGKRATSRGTGLSGHDRRMIAKACVAEGRPGGAIPTSQLSSDSASPSPTAGEGTDSGPPNTVPAPHVSGADATRAASAGFRWRAPISPVPLGLAAAIVFAAAAHQTLVMRRDKRLIAVGGA